MDENDLPMRNIAESIEEDDGMISKVSKLPMAEERERKEFFFQQRRGKLDLRAISNVDIDRLVRDTDIDVLQAFLENITFSNMREEDLRYLTDPLIIKLFRISQMTIEVNLLPIFL